MRPTRIREKKMKKRNFWAIIAFMAVLLSVSVSFNTQSPSNKDKEQVIGVWKQVIEGLPENSNQQRIKIITKGHFIWIHTIDNTLFMSMGGKCTFDGETYTEYIEYGTPTANKAILGKTSVFKITFDGNQMHIIGGPETVTFDEIWERVE